MKYYEINESLAETAKSMKSFSDYIPGSATASYRAAVDKAVKIAERQKSRTDSMYHEKIDGLLDLYARKLAENLNDSFRIDCICPSVLISGASNFPVAKKERQNAAADRNMKQYAEIQGILDRIRSVGTGGISSDDPNALEKLRKKCDALVKHQELMKAANAAIRMKDTVKADAKLAALGYTPGEINQLREADFLGRVGYPSYELSNNNANIKRIQSRIAELEKRHSEPSPEGWKFAGGEVLVNAEENRLQILFDEKPDEQTRSDLKSHGFRWAPSQGAWQRQLTNNALYTAKNHIPAIRPEN